MALGSSAYPDYCNAGKDIDKALTRLGAEALAKIQLGNELEGQAESVREWQVRIHRGVHGLLVWYEKVWVLRHGVVR